MTPLVGNPKIKPPNSQLWINPQFLGKSSILAALMPQLCVCVWGEIQEKFLIESKTRMIVDGMGGWKESRKYIEKMK